MKLPILDLTGAATGEFVLDDDRLIPNGRGTQALQDFIVAYQANQRQGTRSTKTKGEVAGSGKKPWRQKGTGRARAGMVRSPLWRKGGIVFGPRPRDFSIHLPQQVKRLAFRKAISERLQEGAVIVVDELAPPTPKTRSLLETLSRLKLAEEKVLIVQDGIHRNLMLAARNLPKVDVATADTLNAYQVLAAGKLLFTRQAMARVADRLRN